MSHAEQATIEIESARFMHYRACGRRESGTSSSKLLERKFEFEGVVLVVRLWLHGLLHG